MLFQLASILKDEISTDWAPLSVLGTNAIPADCQLLIIGGPRKASFLQEELDKIDSYLKKGGRLLVLLNNNRGSSGIESTLAKWGVGVGDTTITERDPSFIISPSNGSDFRTAELADHPMLTAFIAAKLPGIHMVSPRVIYRMENVSKAPDAAKVSVLAQTSDVAVSAERQGKFPLLIAVEQAGVKGLGGARILVAGNSYFLSDKLIESGANHYFAWLALNWLLELDRPELGLGELGPRPIREYRLLLSSHQIHAVQWIYLLGLPGAVLLIGGLVWLRRRN